MIDGVIDGDINLPGGDILVAGTCTFRGNITAGNLTIGGGTFWLKANLNLKIIVGYFNLIFS